MSPAKKPAKKQAARSKGTGPKASAGASRTAKSTAKKTTSGRSTAKSSVKKTAAKKAAAKKTVAKKTTAKKAPARKTVAKKTTPKKAPARKTVAKKTTAKKAPARKTVAQKTTAKKAPAKKAPVKKTTARAAAKPPARPAQPTRAPRPAKLDKRQLAAIRERLLQEKAQLERQQSELDAEGTQAEAMAEIGLDDDFADAGTATFDRERDLSIRNNITDLIDQITRAVARIDDGTYGTCERCGRPIDAARLKALPHALLCLDCKRREERGR